MSNHFHYRSSSFLASEGTTLSYLTRVTFGVSTCQKMYLGVKPGACTRIYSRATAYNIPGDPLQSEPRLVSHHCTWGGFMNWKRTIHDNLIVMYQGLDSIVFRGKKLFPGDTRVSPLIYKQWKGAHGIYGNAVARHPYEKNPGKHA